MTIMDEDGDDDDNDDDDDEDDHADDSLIGCFIYNF